MNWTSFGRLVAAALLAFATTAVAENRFTGTYIADARPGEMMFLALTQTGESVSGVMTIVSPDRSGGLDNQTLEVHGSADGNSINLTAKRFLSNLLLSGTKSGRSIDVAFPSESGGLATISFTPGTELEFNAAIGEWRQPLLKKHEEQERLDAEVRKTNSDLQNRAQALFANVGIIKTTGIGSDLADIATALRDEHLALNELEGNLSELKRSASVRPMTCYQAYQTVGYDFRQTMGYTFKKTLGYANSQHASTMKALEVRLSHVDPLVASIREGAAKLKEALQASKFAAPALPISPGDELEPVAQYLKLAHSAQERMPTFRSENSQIVAAAKAVMDEGQGVMNQAQSLVRCR